LCNTLINSHFDRSVVVIFDIIATALLLLSSAFHNDNIQTFAISSNCQTCHTVNPPIP